MTKNICLVTVEFPPSVGGIGQSVYRIAKLLTSVGYHIHVAVIELDTRGNSSLAYRNAQIITSLMGDISVSRLYGAVRYDKYFELDFWWDIYNLLKKLHSQEKFDLFHAFYITETGYITTLFAKEMSVPVICSARGTDIHRDVLVLSQNHLWTFENADWLTFVSQDMLHRATVLCSKVKNKSSVIWNSIEPIIVKSPPPAITLPQDAIIIGSLGNFRQKKGIEYLLEGCQLLSKKINLGLLLIGDFREKEAEYWKQTINNSMIKDRIVVTGFLPHEEAIASLQYIDIFVIPSLDDGCPNALLEAMLMSKPIVATHVDAIGEILENNIDALLVPPAMVEPLYDALLQFISNPNFADRLGKAANQKVLSKLSTSVELNAWEICYKRFL